MNKKVFTAKTEDGVEVELCVRKPTAEMRIKSQLVFNREWKRAVDEGSILRRNVEKEAEKLGLWNDTTRKEVEAVAEELRSLERKLRSGANGFSSKDEARKCALEMRVKRAELLELNRSKDELYPFTAESFAEDARLKFLVSQCCLDNNTGKTYFKSYEDYVENGDSEIGQAALSNYIDLVYGDFDDINSSFYENEWLLRNKYVDSKYRLVNADGHLVDEEGRLINENNRYVNAEGEYVDREGNRVDENGNYLVEYKEFD